MLLGNDFYFISLEYFIGWQKHCLTRTACTRVYVAACRCPSTQVLESPSDGFWRQTPGSSFKVRRNHLQLFRGCCTHNNNTHKASLQQSCWSPPVKHQAGAHFYPQVCAQEPHRFQWEPTRFLERISINNFSVYTVEKLELWKPQKGTIASSLQCWGVTGKKATMLCSFPMWQLSRKHSGMVTGMEKIASKQQEILQMILKNHLFLFVRLFFYLWKVQGASAHLKVVSATKHSLPRDVAGTLGICASTEYKLSQRLLSPHRYRGPLSVSHSWR